MSLEQKVFTLRSAIISAKRNIQPDEDSDNQYHSITNKISLEKKPFEKDSRTLQS
jgi:hypothetical protein